MPGEDGQEGHGDRSEPPVQDILGRRSEYSRRADEGSAQDYRVRQETEDRAVFDRTDHHRI